MAALSNSSRQLLKATYAPLDVNMTSEQLLHAQQKAVLVRSLQLQLGEVTAVRTSITRLASAGNTGSTPISDATWATLQQFEPQSVAALAPKASVLANIPVSQLQAFAQATLDHRIAQLHALDQAATHPAPPASAPGGTPPPSAPPPHVSAAPEASVAPTISPADPATGRTPLFGRLFHGTTAADGAASPAAVPTTPTQAFLAKPAAPASAPAPAQLSLPTIASAQVQRATAASLVTFAKASLDTFIKAVTISPVGMLHLERVEMAPAGIERGELVATIPLAPGESTTVEQKEWSVTSQEFTSIVTDYLENYSEKGVAEKSDLSDSTDSQTQHSQQLGLSASLSGSNGFVTFATNASASISDSTNVTKKQSRQDTKEVTTKASSRARKEHQVTIQTVSTVGNSQTTTRTLTNPSTTDPMRIDYFSMMRKWRVRLLQYGLRLTYDLAIPEPAATLREMHARLALLEMKLSGEFTFKVEPTDITEQNYLAKAAEWQVPLEAPPDPFWVHQFNLTLQSSKDSSVAQTVEFDVKDGYAVSQVTVGGYASPSESDLTKGFSLFLAAGRGSVHLSGPFPDVQTWKNRTKSKDFGPKDMAQFTTDSGAAEAFIDAFKGQTGHVSIPLLQDYISSGYLSVGVAADRLDATYRAWQQQAWQALHDAARDAYYTEAQAWAQERDALKARIEGVDTLTLRREEQEEIMKGVLRWLLGPDFDFMPTDVSDLFKGQGAVGQSFTGNELGLGSDGWTMMFVYGEMVKFIQQAIEWENLLYMVYPYFWDVPTAWNFARTLEHPDPTRQAFLRAGSARVVLTVRPGFEEAFTTFVEKGEFGSKNLLPPTHPYLTIGQDIRNYDQTNYPDIPPANPDPQPRPLLTRAQQQAWDDLQTIMAQLDTFKQQNKRYPTTAEGLSALAGPGTSTLPSADPWGRPYQYQCPGNYGDYDLASFGANGVPGGEGDDADITSWADASLIAEWYEYTPTHGVDIAVSSPLPDMG